MMVWQTYMVDIMQTRSWPTMIENFKNKKEDSSMCGCGKRKHREPGEGDVLLAFARQCHARRHDQRLIRVGHHIKDEYFAENRVLVLAAWQERTGVAKMCMSVHA